MPDAVVMLVGTHCDQCKDLDEMMEKKNDIDEKVKAMLANRRMVLNHRKQNLEESTNPCLYMDQMDELECLLDYSLKVLIWIYTYIIVIVIFIYYVIIAFGF